MLKQSIRKLGAVPTPNLNIDEKNSVKIQRTAAKEKNNSENISKNRLEALAGQVIAAHIHRHHTLQLHECAANKKSLQ